MYTIWVTPNHIQLGKFHCTEFRWHLIWSLHLHIDDGTQLIPISMLPVQIWQCEDSIFLITRTCSEYAQIVHTYSFKSIYMIYVHKKKFTPSFRSVRTGRLGGAQRPHANFFANGNNVLTLTQDNNPRGLGTPIGTVPIMLNTSTQNKGYNPSKNSFKLPNTSMHWSQLAGGKQRWSNQWRQLYRKASEMYS